jgi:hypothetical protein
MARNITPLSFKCITHFLIIMSEIESPNLQYLISYYPSKLTQVSDEFSALGNL